MIEEIAREIHEKEMKAAGKKLCSTGAIKSPDQLIDSFPKPNMDLMLLLSELGLIKSTTDNRDLIKEFFNYLRCIGIEIGIVEGKQFIISSIRMVN